MNVAQSVMDWLHKPYSPDMDVWRWILFIGLILIIAAGWSQTVRILEKVA